MSFYTSPSFFVLLAISIIPAAVLGFTGRRIRPYGMAATIVFVALLFSDDVKPVSYTHLDVYKRQHQNHSFRLGSAPSGRNAL